jgi:hypothetical protein
VSPKGVVMAGRNDARYLKDGKEVFIPGPELFGNRWPLKVAEGYEFEAYPNRNSLPYIETYGLAGVRTMLRGTLRNPGWCETLKAIADLGVLKDDAVKPIGGLTPAGWLRAYVPARGMTEVSDISDRVPSGSLRADAAARLGLEESHPILERFAWLGFFDEKPIGLDAGSNLDILAKQMLDRMAYKPGERDMVVLHHEFLAEYPGKPARKIFSTLIDCGIPDGVSSMARIGVKMILEGKLKLTGVQIPVLPEIYEPVLAELARLGIECKEREVPAA